MGGIGDKSLKMSLADTLRMAWADPDLRQRLIFVLGVFAVFALAIHIPVPIPGVSAEAIARAVENNAFLQFLNMFSGRALAKVSIVALGLGPYITASIIMQVLNAANPAWKQELREGGEYARRKQNQRTRALSLVLGVFQGYGILNAITSGLGTRLNPLDQFMVLLFWTAGAMFMLWLGEQVTERGIGNGISMLIFAGIVIAFPSLTQQIYTNVQAGTISWFQVIIVVALFFLSTALIVFFTVAQRRIPIQHMRRQMGTKTMGGQTSYLPFSVNLVGVMPIIFASSLAYLPSQFAMMAGPTSQFGQVLDRISLFLAPNFSRWEGIVASFIYMALIFFFTYFWTAIQFNVDDITDNLRRSGSFIPGVRPGKQTRDFLDGIITRIAIVGAVFLAVVAVSQYVLPLILNLQGIGLLFGTSLLIMVSVALETMRQMEANLLMKQYGQ